MCAIFNCLLGNNVQKDSEAQIYPIISSVSLCSLEYIQTIMMMEESVQHVVMTAIQEVNHHAIETPIKFIADDNWLILRIRWDRSDRFFFFIRNRVVGGIGMTHPA